MNIQGIAHGLLELAHEMSRLAAKMRVGFEEEIGDWGREDLLPTWAVRWPRPEWAGLARTTLQRKARLGYPDTPLIRTGALFTAATVPYARGNIFDVSMPAGSLGLLQVGVDNDVIPYAIRQVNDPLRKIPSRDWQIIDEDVIDALSTRIDRSIRSSEGE